MKKGISFLPVIIFLTCAACSSGPVETKNYVKVKDTVKVLTKPGLTTSYVFEKQSNTPFEDAKTRIDGVEYICNYKGKIYSADTSDNNKKLLFDLKAEYIVDKIYISKYGKGFFMTWQETDHEGVKSYYAYYETGDSAPEWKVAFADHPNPTQPVIDSQYAYVSTLGMVGKLNLDNGVFAWKYDSLFNQHNGAFKEIDPAIVYSKKVIFVDKPIQGKRLKRDSLFIDPVTGAKIR